MSLTKHQKHILAGLSVGMFTTASLVYWGFRSAPSPATAEAAKKLSDYTANDEQSLGFQFDPLPSVARKPLTVDELAKKIGFADGQEALKAAGVLAERVKGGFLPSHWNETCEKDHGPLLCSIVQDYLGPKLLPALPGVTTKRVRNRKIYPFVTKFVPNLQNEDYSLQVRRASEWSLKQIEKFAEVSFKTTGCPRTFSLTLAREVEPHLHQPKAWELMDALDKHGLECVKSDDPWAEMVFLRVATLKLTRKQWTEAIPLLEKALQANARREEFRSLFWLSEARLNAGLKKDSEGARQTLWKSYPLSWHTILSRIEDGHDPLEGIKAKALYTDEYDSGDAMLDKRAAWLQLLMAMDDIPFVVRHYGEFVVKSFGPNLNPGFVQHLARLFNRAGFYRLQILALSQMVYARPDTVTLETLRLLYPRPYFEELSNESKLDTAILLGLARQESGFDPNATSKANAQGLLQLLPSTAKAIHKTKGKKLYDYSKNIELGAAYLLKLSRSFNGSIEKTLASYNAGQTVVGKWSARFDFVQDPQLFVDMIPYRETREYVPSILRNAYWYHRLFPELTKSLTNETVSSSILKTLLKINLPTGTTPKPAGVEDSEETGTGR